MGRMVIAFGLILLAPLVFLVFASQALAILFSIALVGGVGLVVYAIATVARAYLGWIARRTRARRGVRRSVAVVGWFLIGAIVGAILLPAYFMHGSFAGMLDGGGAGGRGVGTTGVIPASGWFAAVVVAVLVFATPLLGLTYVALSFGLFWVHKSRIRIDGRPTSVGLGALIDWLEHDAGPVR